MTTYRTLGRHEDIDGRGEPCTSFGATEPLSLSHLQYAFSEVQQPSVDRPLMPQGGPPFGGLSAEFPGTVLEGPSSTVDEFSLEERRQRAPSHPSVVELEVYLPGRDGASC